MKYLVESNENAMKSAAPELKKITDKISGMIDGAKIKSHKSDDGSTFFSIGHDFTKEEIDAVRSEFKGKGFKCKVVGGILDCIVARSKYDILVRVYKDGVVVAAEPKGMLLV